MFETVRKDPKRENLHLGQRTRTPLTLGKDPREPNHLGDPAAVRLTLQFDRKSCVAHGASIPRAAAVDARRPPREHQGVGPSRYNSYRYWEQTMERERRRKAWAR